MRKLATIGKRKARSAVIQLEGGKEKVSVEKELKFFVPPTQQLFDRALEVFDAVTIHQDWRG